MTDSEFIVMTSSAQVGTLRRRWGARYRHVAVVEVDPGARPSRIWERAKGVRRIVHKWSACHVGATDRCAYARALADAIAIAANLNKRAGQ